MSSTPSASTQAFSFVERLAQDLKDERLELPAFPDAVLRIQQALQNEHTRPDDIATILGSEPALAARLLKFANSVEFRRGDTEITDLRTAIGRMGFNMIRSVAVSFAMRQLRRKDELAPIQPQLKTIWQDSIQTAAYCHVLARNVKAVNTDEAMLTGLLHVLGRLYIVMRAQELNVEDDSDVNLIVNDWHTTIAQAIAENWGLPKSLREALAHQNEFTSVCTGPLSQTDILRSARLLATSDNIDAELLQFPVMQRMNLDAEALEGFTETHADELQRIRHSLAG
jgi:HD-like signal output (HDOD) protein